MLDLCLPAFIDRNDTKLPIVFLFVQLYITLSNNVQCRWVSDSLLYTTFKKLFCEFMDMCRKMGVLGIGKEKGL